MRAVARDWKVARRAVPEVGRVARGRGRRRPAARRRLVGARRPASPGTPTTSPRTKRSRRRRGRGPRRSSTAGEHRLVVLDEITYPMMGGWIDTDDVVATIRDRPAAGERRRDRPRRARRAHRRGRHGHRDAQDQARVRRRHPRQEGHRLLTRARARTEQHMTCPNCGAERRREPPLLRQVRNRARRVDPPRRLRGRDPADAPAAPGGAIAAAAAGRAGPPPSAAPRRSRRSLRAAGPHPSGLRRTAARLRPRPPGYPAARPATPRPPPVTARRPVTRRVRRPGIPAARRRLAAVRHTRRRTPTASRSRASCSAWSAGPSAASGRCRDRARLRRPRARSSSSGGRQAGSGMATAGIILGFVAIAFLAAHLHRRPRAATAAEPPILGSGSDGRRPR